MAKKRSIKLTDPNDGNHNIVYSISFGGDGQMLISINVMFDWVTEFALIMIFSKELSLPYEKIKIVYDSTTVAPRGAVEVLLKDLKENKKSGTCFPLSIAS